MALLSNPTPKNIALAVLITLITLGVVKSSIDKKWEGSDK